MIVFLCKGNIHRSRFASAYFTRLTGMQSYSYGTHGHLGAKLCPKVMKFVKDKYNLNIDFPIRHITRNILERASRVYYMSRDNYLCLSPYLLSHYDHIQTLNLYGGEVGHNGACITDPGYPIGDITKETFMEEIKNALDLRFATETW